MFDLKETILARTQYVSGYINEEDKYVISASMMGKEPLQNYLSILHGKVADTEITDATLGSIFHLGMEHIVDTHVLNAQDHPPIIGKELAMHTELPNGWILSGTADLVTNPVKRLYNIRDYKLSKTYALKMLKKELHTHDYTKQLQTLEALFRLTFGDSEIDGVSLTCDFFTKDAKAILHEATYNPVDIPNKVGVPEMTATEIVVAEAVAITDSLQAYIESGEIPPMCADRWPRNVKGKTIPTKCALYCSHGKAGLCPHYNPRDEQTVERLVNW